MPIFPQKTHYSGTSPYDHLTTKKTSLLQSPWLSPKLNSTVEITPCNKVTSPLRSFLPSPVGDINGEVPLATSYILLSSSNNVPAIDNLDADRHVFIGRLVLLLGSRHRARVVSMAAVAPPVGNQYKIHGITE